MLSRCIIGYHSRSVVVQSRHNQPEPHAALKETHRQQFIRKLLLAYVLTDQQANPIQHGLIATALHWRPLDAKLHGVAPTLKGLEGTWAVSGTGYASRVAEIGQAIQQS